MQRQSLGSPSAVAVAVGRLPCGEECKQEQGEEGEDSKKMMKLRQRTLETGNYYIHLIPLLTLICFLILFLNSHKPTENDLFQYNGAEAFSQSSDVQETVEATKMDIVFVAATTAKQRRLHRKLGRL